MDVCPYLSVAVHLLHVLKRRPSLAWRFSCVLSATSDSWTLEVFSQLPLHLPKSIVDAVVVSDADLCPMIFQRPVSMKD